MTGGNKIIIIKIIIIITEPVNLEMINKIIFAMHGYAHRFLSLAVF